MRSSRAVVLIVRLQKLVAVLVYEPLNLPQVVGTDTPVSSHHNRFEPELAFAVGTTNVNVRRFVSLIGIEVEAIPANSEDSRHGESSQDSDLSRQRHQIVVGGTFGD
jgi:hypothetical protein